MLKIYIYLYVLHRIHRFLYHEILSIKTYFPISSFSIMNANVLNDHIHQFSVLIGCTLCMRCVSSDENCLPPTAPTGADVSFFSTLGCSLQGALTTGSMALALLSPFIWSERVLAPVLVCRWPSFHLASPLLPPLSSPDSWLP